MDAVVHFEMPYDDAKRVAAFYSSAFGWDTKALGAEMGDYVLAMTTATDARGPTTPGAINGGFFKRKPDWPAQYPSVVIAVDDIARRARRCAGRRRGARRADGDPRRRPVRLLHRPGRQSRRHAAAGGRAG